MSGRLQLVLVDIKKSLCRIIWRQRRTGAAGKTEAIETSLYK